MRCWWACFFMIACVACNSTVKQDNTVSIHLSNDSQTVYISGLEYSILQEFKKDSLTTETWHGIFPVYIMPADTELKDFQKEISGTYQVTDTTLVFKPDTAFKKHQQYLVHFYGNGENYSTVNLLRSKSKLKGQNFKEVIIKL
jgi:hypothetical protein